MMDYCEYGLEWLGSVKDEKILLYVSAPAFKMDFPSWSYLALSQPLISSAARERGTCFTGFSCSVPKQADRQPAPKNTTDKLSHYTDKRSRSL